MADLVLNIVTLLLSLFGGVLGAASLFYVRDIRLYSRRNREQRRRDLVQRKLEKLYTPLFMRVKFQEFIIDDETTKPNITYITYSKSDDDKKDLDSTILNHGYLADDELMPLLPRMLGVAFFDERNRESAHNAARLIMSGYETLREEYLGLASHARPVFAADRNEHIDRTQSKAISKRRPRITKKDFYLVLIAGTSGVIFAKIFDYCTNIVNQNYTKEPSGLFWILVSVVLWIILCGLALAGIVLFFEKIGWIESESEI